ncbi:hypothetical protein C6P46_001900 [Rhodotorula mucilaginosa]|uniref:Uncharacterized protein n=1 Tax=Rhodotorula mucilaginosa TaxID=5537 RepID=A0A9P6W4V1_RHOMI|nr:hypothetical protein C6P46_001900 [Rhodotorula mucilaginosa]
MPGKTHTQRQDGAFPLLPVTQAQLAPVCLSHVDSSSLKLELVAEQLGALSLRDDPDTVEFVVGLVEEESFEAEVSTSLAADPAQMRESEEYTADRIGEALSSACSKRKMTMVRLSRAALPRVNLRVDKILAVTTADAVDKLLEETSVYQDKVLAARRAAEEAEAAAAAAAAEEAAQSAGNKLSPADEAKRKAELLKASHPQYGYLEEETEADRLAREEAERAPDKALLDPRQMSKKQRKKALEGVDLLALPNLNKAHVDAAEKQRRAASASAAQAKKARDEADRKKQKDDEKRKLEEKRKKAQKVERKA